MGRPILGGPFYRHALTPISSSDSTYEWGLGYSKSRRERRSELLCIGSVCSSLLAMDGGRLKGCMEGGRFRLVISTKRDSMKTATRLGIDV